MKIARSVLSEDDITRILDRVDWNFPRSSTPARTVHSLHWFPGNFIPQIPAYLIQLLSTPGDLVLDPFAGSGTTGVEAIQLDRRIWLSDINRASIQVTRGKLAGIATHNISKALSKLLADLVWEPILRSDQPGRRGEGTDPELACWLHLDTIAQLRYLWTLVESSADANLRSFLELLFTDTLFACGSVGRARTSTGRRRRHHWGWIADNVKPMTPPWHNAIGLFRDRLVQAIDLLKAIAPTSTASAVILREDIRRLSIADCSVDLVVTSPPYLGMIDYALANRLTYLWMGWSLEEDRQLEIGARFKRNRLKAVDDYLESMSAACTRIVMSLRPHGYCAIVIGASRKYPDAALPVVDVFKKKLKVIWGPTNRTPTRRRVSDRLGTEPTEWLCVFRKDEPS